MELERPDKPCSLARLSKQAQRPMSVLRRQLTMLEEAGLVALALEEAASAAPSSSRRRRELANQLRA
jgi:DNA-binding IclR family transcriptional regulator